ncbi:MAG TPA: precorrin-4 C(11)-methyltransferase [Lentisphaeria bacterium]|nr:MAG: precorrin-4 C(11)-methyltransferase [Lentisphaerae bacterium GWF2_50_93]HCE42288.1 precorrin-4 C(11)-methyltransferase [Lentisphaeria bacterium]
MVRKIKNNVIFAGAGPGAPDLITLRCLKAIQHADLIVYAGSLVNPEILKHAKSSCKIVDSATISLLEIVKLMKDAFFQGKKVLRLHTGDPAIYGAIAEQMTELDKLKIPYEVIPGVSSVFASAAALKTELTAPGVSQTVILTRQSGRTPVPHGQEIANLAKHGATMAIFLSSGDVKSLTGELIRGGYSPETPASVVYRASWKEEKITRGTLADIDDKLEASGFIGRQAMIIVGDVLDRKKGGKSLLYDAGFTHGYRKAAEERIGESENRRIGDFKGKIAVYAITAEGLSTAQKLLSCMKHGLLFAPERFKNSSVKNSGTEFFKEGEFDEALRRTWSKFDGHIFLMATGIVVRKISKLVGSKTTDPAVVVCDQRGNYAISLLSGHIGGANRLAKFAAEVLGGQAVVTTATDVQNLMAFDEMASIEGWKVANPEMIKVLNSMLLEGKKIGLLIPKDIFKKYYSSKKNLSHISKATGLKTSRFHGAVVLNMNIKSTSMPVLKLSS